MSTLAKTLANASGLVSPAVVAMAVAIDARAAERGLVTPYAAPIEGDGLHLGWQEASHAGCEVYDGAVGVFVRTGVSPADDAAVADAIADFLARWPRRVAP